jgi:hypothetical protein
VFFYNLLMYRKTVKELQNCAKFNLGNCMYVCRYVAQHKNRDMHCCCAIDIIM